MGPAVSNYVMHTQADMSKTEHDLGFKAKYTLEEGIKQVVSEQVSVKN